MYYYYREKETGAELWTMRLLLVAMGSIVLLNVNIRGWRNIAVPANAQTFR